MNTQVALPGRPDRLYDGYIFDLDGTLLLGKDLLPGAQKLLEFLQRQQVRILYVTNNPTKRNRDVVTRLASNGIPVTEDDVVNTILTTVSWLQTHAPDAVVFPIAEAPVLEALSAAGIQTSENPEDIDIILASYDRTFTYRKLQIAFDAVHRYGKARLFATNPDRYCPMPDGGGEPDCAAIVGAITGCTGLELERHFGKPDPWMLQTAMEQMQLDVAQCLMCGDRLTTDIRMAIDAGMDSALPLTGETTRELLGSQPASSLPTWIVDRIDQLIPE